MVNVVDELLAQEKIESTTVEGVPRDDSADD